MTKRTKIVCTLGPAVDNESTLRNLILAGMNVARINVSHGNHEEHRARISRLKKIRRELQLPVAILFDTRGPEVRTGCLVNGEPITLYAGNHLRCAKKASTVQLSASSNPMLVFRATLSQALPFFWMMA